MSRLSYGYADVDSRRNPGLFPEARRVGVGIFETIGQTGEAAFAATQKREAEVSPFDTRRKNIYLERLVESARRRMENGEQERRRHGFFVGSLSFSIGRERGSRRI